VRRYLAFSLILLLAGAAGAADLEGFIWDTGESFLVVEGREVEITPRTRIDRANHPDITTDDLRIGWEVRVRADPAADGGLVARSISVKSPRNRKIEIEGYVEETRDRTFYADGRDILWPTDLDRDSVEIGMQIEGEGILRDDGLVQLTRYKVEPRTIGPREQQYLARVAAERESMTASLDYHDNLALALYLEQVGQSLVPGHVRTSGLEITFLLIDDPEPNAFAMADGTIVVHRGLLDLLENEAQLAAVLGHELAHATHRHGYRTYKAQRRSRWVGIGALVAGVIFDVYADTSLGTDIAELGGTYGLSAAVNGHSRNLEDDADRIGLRYMLDAGYDPHQALEVWRLMSEHYGDSGKVSNWFFGSHSTHQARISNLTREINSNYRGRLDLDSLDTGEEPYQLALAAAPSTLVVGPEDGEVRIGSVQIGPGVIIGDNVFIEGREVNQESLALLRSDPDAARGRIDEDFRRLAAMITEYYAAHGSLPGEGAAFFTAWESLRDEPVPTDPYDGLPYGYAPAASSARFWSAGPDGEPATDDDVEILIEVGSSDSSRG
jgi:Zn-dependent protease with chaperone function